MSNKFLGATNAGNLADGTVLIHASSLGASGLNASYPVKTNSLRQLVSSKLNISDINNLQDTLDNVLTNPFAGTLHVTDLETANHFSLNDELNKIDNITSATQGPAVTNISGLVSVQEISTDRIYNTAQTIWVDMDANTVDVSATNLKLNGNNVITTPYSGQLEATSFKKTGGTGIEYLMANGSTLTQSANSGNSNFYLYNNSVLQTMPISGSITYNNTDPLLATYVYLSNITRDAIDILVFFKQINQLNDLYIQDQESSLNFIKYNITGTPIISATYIAIPVIKTTSGGDTSFGSKPVMVSFFTNNLEIDTRLSAVETKTQNQTATALTTTFAPGTTVVCETIQPNVIKTSEINTVVLDGTMSVGTYSGNINLGRAGKTMTIQSDLLVANVINSTSSYAPDVYSDNIWADKVDTNTVHPLNIGTVNSSIITLGKAGQNTVVNSDNLIANNFFKFGGLSSEFLKANGTIDSNTYLTSTALTSLNDKTYHQSKPTAFNTTFNSDIYPLQDNLFNLGFSTNKWRYLFCSVAVEVPTIDQVIYGNTLYVGPALAGAVEIGRSAIQTNILGTTMINNAYTLPTVAPQVGQILQCNSLGSSSWTTSTYLTSVITSGYPFNPVSRATGTITSSTKSYYFTCLINQATLISGLSIYLDNGSDNFRMGIYRGCINTLTSASMTLCGQTAGGVLPISATTVFHRVPITAVLGQNLTFANGEYMTIAFHSAGSTNVFLTGQTTTAFWAELGYNTTANYAVAGFPATISPSAVLGGIPQRPCFELY